LELVVTAAAAAAGVELQMEGRHGWDGFEYYNY
jgi:hypothetical protein